MTKSEAIKRAIKALEYQISSSDIGYINCPKLREGVHQEDDKNKLAIEILRKL
jgi:hypothetical protein